MIDIYSGRTGVGGRTDGEFGIDGYGWVWVGMVGYAYGCVCPWLWIGINNIKKKRE